MAGVSMATNSNEVLDIINEQKRRAMRRQKELVLASMQSHKDISNKKLESTDDT